ncbi:IS30 family transposase [Stenotrophomonas maltophilia]|uniref:IS30 family transposase n=3 Tax=Gammaproteobacteria TaxID=1236 RepID=UPI0015DCA19C|nr:IS30 family transposase [Stenotrophomonas maltophilia]BBQ11040.1 IS30 family transposase [Stenotrophomonas maltophilia]BBQ13124.1 IS30 family transposase [Stenotrophomonas maltophilia]
MKRRSRIRYTDSQKALMWDRWQQGESLHQIARLFDRHHSSVRGILAESGGIRPAPRRRSLRSLSLAEREEVSRALVAGHSIRSIATTLGRAPSTISREIRRNGGVECYRASHADQAAWDRAHRPKACKLALHPALAKRVADKLQQQWSPQQIAGWLMRTYPDDATCQVSHETIYRTLFIQSRGALKKELLEHLRRSRAMRRSRHHTQKTANHGRISDTISISERPAAVEDRAVPGHWEGDLLCGSSNSQIATLVERSTRYVMLVKVDRKDTQTVVDALIRTARKLPDELYKSLTWDRGKEMADHRRFTLATDIQVYFCDPQSPWQRGLNENTNGLLRQYFPKGIDLSTFSQAKLNEVARRLNERPRKTLGYETPIERYRQAVASTG